MGICEGRLSAYSNDANRDVVAAIALARQVDQPAAGCFGGRQVDSGNDVLGSDAIVQAVGTEDKGLAAVQANAALRMDLQTLGGAKRTQEDAAEGMPVRLAGADDAVPDHLFDQRIILGELCTAPLRTAIQAAVANMRINHILIEHAHKSHLDR